MMLRLCRWLGVSPFQLAGLLLAVGGVVLCCVLMFLPTRYPGLLALATAMIGISLLMLDYHRKRKP